MSIDINGLSAKELETLITQARKRKTVLKKRKPVGTVRSRLTALAKAATGQPIPYWAALSGAALVTASFLLLFGRMLKSTENQPILE